jgi:hypothetical protein
MMLRSSLSPCIKRRGQTHPITIFIDVVLCYDLQIASSDSMFTATGQTPYTLTIVLINELAGVWGCKNCACGRKC